MAGPAEQTYAQRLADARAQFEGLTQGTDPDALAADLGRLEDEMGAPGFWDDQERAAKVSAEHARTSKRLEAFRSLRRDVDELEDYVALADEDEEVAAELPDQFGSV